MTHDDDVGKITTENTQEYCWTRQSDCIVGTCSKRYQWMAANVMKMIGFYATGVSVFDNIQSCIL